MKTQSINWSTGQTSSPSISKSADGIRKADPAEIRKAMNAVTGYVVRGSIATFVVMAILVAAIWASQSLAASGIVQAIIWANSLVFLALAVESSAARFQSLLVSGLALGVLALLSSPQAAGFSILAAAVIAAWAAWAIMQGWKKA
jgi:hypothetical protein